MVPGARVKFTARYLISTGQTLGDEGLKEWVILPCMCGLCRNGSFVCTNEEIAPRTYRHVHKGNLFVVGGNLTTRNEAP